MTHVWIAAAAAVLAMAGGASGEEPNANQVPPENPQWVKLGVDGKGNSQLLEVTTAGRVGDTGYVWLGLFTTDPLGPTLFHVVIDCPTSTIGQDWAVLYAPAPDLAPVMGQPVDLRRQASTDEERTMVEAVCSGRPVSMGPVLYGIAAADTYVKTGVPGAEPGVPSHFVLPAPMTLQRVDAQADGSHVFIETTTAGRVGDTGYVWHMTMSPSVTLVPPVFRHWVIDCPSAAITEDWRIDMDANHLITSQGAETLTFEARDDIDRKVVAAVCAGGPVSTGGMVFATIDETMLDTLAVESDRQIREFFDSEPSDEWEEEDVAAAEPAPSPQPSADFQIGGLPSRPLDATMLPPLTQLSLVEILDATGTEMPFKIFLEENWLENSAGSGAGWVFLAFSHLVRDDGREVAGIWMKYHYGCSPPETFTTIVEASIGRDGGLITGRALDAPEATVDPYSFHQYAVDAACNGKLPPTDMKRYSAILDAKADVERTEAALSN